MNQKDLDHCVLAGRVLPILEARARDESISRRRWLEDGLRTALDRADPGSVSPDTLDHLRRLGLEEDTLAAVAEPPSEHAVHLPLVGDEAHTGFCRLMLVTYDLGTADPHEPLDPDARIAVADAFRAASARTRWHPEERWCFAPSRAKGLDHVRVYGGSLGAAAFVSAYAAWSRRRVWPGTAVTGCLLEGRLGSVGGMDAKVRTLVGRTDIVRLVVPTADGPHAAAVAAELGLSCEVIAVPSLDRLLEVCLSPARVVRPHIEREVAEVRDAWNQGWQGWRWPALRERLSRLVFDVPSGRPDLLVQTRVMLAASYRNLGDANAALEAIGQALAVLTTEEADLAVGDYDRSFLYRHLALVYKQLCRFEEADEAAREAIGHARRGRLRPPLASALGTAGLVALAAGELGRATEYVTEALGHTLELDLHRAPRSGAYVVLAHGRAGHFEEAEAQYRKTLTLLAELGESDRTRTDEQWLRTYMAEAAHLAGRPGVALEVLSVPCVTEAIARMPLPGLLARRWLGLAEIALGELERGFSRLASAPSVHPHSKWDLVRFTAHLDVLYEAEARLAHGRFDDDARGRALLALDHLPRSPEAAAFLQVSLATARALLDRHAPDPAALGDALRALLVASRALE